MSLVSNRLVWGGGGGGEGEHDYMANLKYHIAKGSTSLPLSTMNEKVNVRHTNV